MQLTLTTDKGEIITTWQFADMCEFDQKCWDLEDVIREEVSATEDAEK